MPRYYTIASSSSMYPNELHIAISLSAYDVTVNGSSKKREGLVSGYLNDLWKQWKAGNTQLSIKSKGFVKESLFEMPASAETPMIMIGPGTGVVPFIGFMQERQMTKKADKDAALGQASLYFGCREKNTDFIYRDYMTEMHDTGIITGLNLAFSRPQEAGAVKQYVQDVLREQAETVKDILVKQNGQIFVCGATRMGKDVENLLKELLGADYVKQMQTEKRYKVELWSA